MSHLPRRVTLKYILLFSSLCTALLLSLIASVILNFHQNLEFTIIGCLVLAVLTDEFFILEETKLGLK